MSGPPGGPGALPGAELVLALGAFLVLLVAERLFELRLSARHIALLEARGAVEHGRSHFPLVVLVHVLLPLGMIAEFRFLGARPGPEWPLWAVLFLAGQALRFAAIRALGEYWNVRVFVVPGTARVHRGPYRFLRHPNYVAVVVELAAAPLLFGAWRTAAVVSALNALVLALRIRTEERALGRS